jgi:sRNA-binding carbon storage regulator CsrA
VLTLTRRTGEVVLITVAPNQETVRVALILNEVKGAHSVSLGFDGPGALIHREEVAPRADVVARIHEAFARRSRGDR